MTDDNLGSEEVPEYDDASYAEIRTLLADAAAPAAVPPDVAARLDATLADLVAGRADDTVVPLHPRPRRRPIGQRLLVAAAAVVLVGAGGVGVAQVLESTRQDDSMSATADQDASAEAPQVTSGDVPEVAAGGQDTSSDSVKNQRSALARRLAATAFTSAGFSRQVTELIDLPADSIPLSGTSGSMDPGLVPSPEQQYDGTGTTPKPTPQRDRVQSELNALDTAAKAAPPCAGPATLPEGAVALRITFDDRPAVLVLHPVVGASRYVAAWSCDGHELLAYTTLPS